MAIPDSVQSVTLNFGPYFDPAGNPLADAPFWIECPAAPITTADGAVVVKSRVRVITGSDGTASTELVAVDATGLSKTGFTYSVTGPAEVLDAPVVISLPSSVPVVDFDTLMPTEASDGSIVSLPVAQMIADALAGFQGGGGSGISALGALELQPFWGFGHSWLATNTNATPNARWHERVASRLRMGPITNKGLSGRTIGDIATAALTATNGWTPRTKALIGAVCTINDATLFNGSAAERAGYKHAWRAFLATLTANGVVAANTASFAYSAGWTAEVVATSTTQAASTNATGGTRFKTSTVGSYFEFTFTGTQADVFLVARAAGAGLITFTEGATTLGTLDLTAATAQDTPAVFKLRGLSSATHTIRGTLTSGASLTVDSYRIPLITPPPILVLGEPPVIPAGGDMAGYVAEVEFLKSYLAAIVAEYPSALYLNLTTAGGWDAATMLSSDGKHPNDKGVSWIADKAVAALASVPFSVGLNVLGTAYPSTYTAPTGPSIPVGGQDGTGAAGAAPGDVIAPTVPGTPVATAGVNQISLAWTGSTDAVGVTGYRIYRSDAPTVVLATTAAITYVDATATPGTAYTYTISARDAAGNESAKSAASNSATATAPLVAGITDTFNRADATALGTTSDGTATWTASGTTTIGVASNRTKATGGTGNGYATIAGGSVNGTVKATLAAVSGSPTTMISGLVCQYTDTNNHVVLALRSDSTTAKYALTKRTGGTLSTLSPVSTVTPAAGDVVELIVNGQNYRVKVNGVEIININITVAPPTPTQNVGIYANNSDTVSAWDDWSFVAA